MPGISFLFKKGFHPNRIDNQKKVYLAEQSVIDRKEKEAISANEVLKEKEILEYEAMGSMQQRDPRSSALKFMYSMPNVDNNDKRKKELNENGKHYEPKINQNGEDEMVLKFKAKLLEQQEKLKNNSATKHHANNSTVNDEKIDVALQQEAAEKDLLQSKLKGAIMQPQTTLEKALGRRTQIGVTNDEQVSRHPFLKNAPVEGSYAKNMSAHHKPFNEVIRNVKCTRCGKWGHCSGERECELRDFNPQDSARQRREDPMAKYVDAQQDINDNRNRGNKYFSNATSSSSVRGSGNGTHGSRGTGTQGVDDYGEEDESDPEALFLATLSRREKKLLLRKLQQLESGVSAHPTDNSGSSSSSDDSSSSSRSESESSSSDDSDESEADGKKRKSRAHGRKKKKSSSSDKKSRKKNKRHKSDKERRHKS